MMKKKYLICLIGMAVLLFSCTEKELTPISESTGKPGVVTDISSVRTPGGAIISYRIPNDPNVLAVKAVYTLTNGTTLEASASFYGNQLELEGYTDTIEHDALLYTVNRAQELSEPAVAKFRPLEAPISKAIKSVTIESDFGGARYNWVNVDRKPLTFEIMAEDSTTKAMQIVRILASTMDTLSYTLRGYRAVPQKFALVISDNYGNISEAIYPEGGTLTPLHEEKFDKKIQKIMILAGDVTFSNWEGKNEFMIDDDLGTFGHSYTATVPGASFTLDLGKKAKLSRFLYYQRGDGGRWYKAGNAQTFEVYAYQGEAETPQGDWSEWVKVVDAVVIKPSGYEDGTVTDDDIIYAQAGHDFSFPLSLEPVRFLRFIALTVWKNWNDAQNYWHPVEITIYGVYD
jgi:hypothetical protein